MSTSTDTAELAKALAAAQGEIQNATLNKVNPHFKNKYADLAAIRDAVMPALAKQNIAVTQTTEVHGDGAQFMLCTRLTHMSGQWIESQYPLPLSVDRPQAMGSALTYARRYCLSAIVGIASEDDDDGEEGQKAGDEQRQANVPQPRKVEPGLTSGLTKTALTMELRKVATELAGIDGLGSLDALLNAHKTILDQCKRDLPKWWDNEGDTPGFRQRIEAKRVEIEEREAMQDMDDAARAVAAE